MIARLYGCHSLADGFDYAGAFMAEDDGEGTFWVFA
jgi:hypothetical protein